jgi:hypothetical protein
MPEKNIQIKQKAVEREATKATMKGKMNTVLRYLPNIIINTFAVIALMLMTLLMFDFNPNVMFSWGALITILVLVAIFTTSHWSAFDMRLKALQNNQENKDYIKENLEKVKVVTNSTDWFDYKQDFINERNYQKKVEAWKIHIQNQLVKLENKAKPKDLDIESMSVTQYQREHLNETEIKKLEIEIDNSKKNSRYLQRKNAYLEMLTDKWIAENLDKKNLDYNKIDVLFVETGSVIQGQEKDKQEKKGKYVKDNSGQRLFSVFISIFFAALSAELAVSKFTAEAWFIFLFRLTILTFNIILGLNYAERYFVETDIHNAEARKMISDEFKVWNMKRKQA